MKVTLYSNGCPNCKGLKKILESNKIEFDTFSDEEKMIKMGLSKVPLLKIEDGEKVEFMDYKTAVKWLGV